jgi:hypothetical protein
VALFFWLAPNKRLPERIGGDTLDDESAKIMQPLLRTAQYAVEHGYLDADEIAMLFADEAAPTFLCRAARTALARKCEIDAGEADKVFSFLEPDDALAASVRDYLRTTPEYARLEAAWKKAVAEGKAGISAEPPDPLKVLENLTEQSLGDWNPLGSRDELNLTLKTPRKPYFTDGEYDKAQDAVVWQATMNGDHGLPVLCTALWSMSDESYQQKHFGKIAVVDEALAKFAAAYGSLPAARQAEFKQHLDALEPGDAIKGRVQDFSFHEPVDDATKSAGERLTSILAGEL